MRCPKCGTQHIMLNIDFDDDMIVLWCHECVKEFLMCLKAKEAK